MRRSLILATTLVALALPATAYAGYGNLDSSFGALGIAPVDLGGEDMANGITYDHAGRIVAAGGGAIDDPSRPGSTALTVVRYLESGALDPAFGGGDGIVQTVTARQSASFASVMIDAEKRIVAVGSAVGFDGIGSEVVVARYLEDGSPDPSFGTDGLVTLGGSGLWIARDAVLSRDQIVVLALTDGPGGLRPIVARLRDDGSLDPSFSGDGQLRLVSGRLASATALAQPADGLILAGASKRGDMAAAKLREDGTRDTSWGKSGYARLRFPGDSKATELDIDERGYAVLAGSRSGRHGSSTAVARLRPGGATDDSFSRDGRTTVRLGSKRASGEAAALISIGGRRTYIGAAVSNGPRRRSALIRLSGSGRRDRSFSRDGVTSPGFGSALPGYRGDVLSDLVVDTSGRVLVAGTIFLADSDLVVARFAP